MPRDPRPTSQPARHVTHRQRVTAQAAWLVNDAGIRFERVARGVAFGPWRRTPVIAPRADDVANTPPPALLVAVIRS